LGPVLARRFELVGLSRSSRPPSKGYREWRATDLFSLGDAERALEGVDRAVYLVHSMLPTERLAQGRFEDFDLICADNFARAAKRAGVKQIVYLGGLAPSVDEAALSRHLGSRLETERALAAHGVPVITLRAGLVIGPGGSSFEMMARLVRRLPMMACPAWTQTRTQPVALDDVIRVIDACLGDENVPAGVYDIGCPEVLSYREMMQETATMLGLRRPMIEVPFLTTGLSRLWVSLVTGAPRELVAPLIESLVHPMVARDLSLQRSLGLEPTPLRVALQQALSPPSPASSSETIVERTTSGDTKKLMHTTGPSTPASIRKRPRSRVRSIQRLRLPPGRDATWVAAEYVRWLPRRMRPLLRVVTQQGETRFHAFGIGPPLLVLTEQPERTTPDRQVLRVSGGLLADTRGSAPPWPRLEFRVVNDGRHVLAAVHDFVPRLPWLIYVATQAIVHLWVMRSFGRHLARLARAAQGGSDSSD
jgi:uncharacterized protein YbjT (DUF2867 family)